MGYNEKLKKLIEEQFNVSSFGDIPFFKHYNHFQFNRPFDFQVAWEKHITLAEIYLNEKEFEKLYSALDKAASLFFTARSQNALLIDNLQMLIRRDAIYDFGVIKSLDASRLDESFKFLQLSKSEGFYILKALSTIAPLWLNSELHLCSQRYKEWMHEGARKHFVEQCANLLENVVDIEVAEEVVKRLQSGIEDKASYLLEAYYTSFFKFTRHLSMEPAGFICSLKLGDLARLQLQLDNQTAVIEYWKESKARIVAFVISRNDCKTVDIDLGNYKLIQEAFDTFRKGEGWNSRFKDTQNTAADLLEEHIEYFKTYYDKSIDTSDTKLSSEVLALVHKALIAPIYEHIAAFEQIYFVPHGPLHLIPFHALTDNDNIALIEKFKIGYLPYAKFILDHGIHYNVNWQSLVTLGNPNRNNMSMVLPFAEMESNAIAQKTALSAQAYTGQDAVSSRLLQLPEYTILHFSGHGAGNKMAGIFSYLHLADSILTGEELLLNEQYTFSKQLIFLNGCHTGTKDWRSFDEHQGLMAVFLCKGAYFVVSSLWAVDDLSGYFFAVYFFQELTAGADPHESFRKAIHSLRNITLFDCMETCIATLRSDEFPITSIEYKKIIATMFHFWSQAKPETSTELKSFEKTVLQDGWLLENRSSLQTAHPFTHPFYWAGYQIFGC